MFKGTFAASVTTGADSAIQAAAAASVLNATPKSGSLGELTKALFASIASTIIAVVDYGRGSVSVYKHSANNNTRIVNLMGGTKLDLVASDINTSSPGWSLVKDGVNIGDVTAAYDPGFDTDGVTPLADVRTDFEKSLAAEFQPTPSNINAASLVERVGKILEANNKEGFLVINDQTKAFTLYVIDDTSSQLAFQSSSGITSLDAGAFGGVFSVPPVVAASGASVI